MLIGIVDNLESRSEVVGGLQVWEGGSIKSEVSKPESLVHFGQTRFQDGTHFFSHRKTFTI
jgi:hypothetical protein